MQSCATLVAIIWGSCRKLAQIFVARAASSPQFDTAGKRSEDFEAKLTGN